MPKAELLIPQKKADPVSKNMNILDNRSNVELVVTPLPEKQDKIQNVTVLPINEEKSSCSQISISEPVLKCNLKRVLNKTLNCQIKKKKKSMFNI